MNSRTITLAIGVLFISLFSHSQEIEEKQIAFANKFIEAVSEHNTKKVIKMMDKEYRKEQISFLNGNKEQFVNELFSGEDMSDPSIYVNVKLDEITKIEIAEVTELKGNKYNYVFRVRTAEFDLFSSLILKKRGRKYGFVGAVG